MKEAQPVAWLPLIFMAYSLACLAAAELLTSSGYDANQSMLRSRMIKLFLLPATISVFLVPAFADVMSVTGSASGAFANPSGGSVNGATWTYYATDTVTFAGAAFNGSTPESFDFGTITLNHPVNSGTSTLTADLDLTVNFTTPNGQHVNFVDGLQLQTQNGNHPDTLVLNFMGFPGPQSFTVGGETYTVSYSGFSSSSSTFASVSSLTVDRGSSGSAYLWGSITADPNSVTTASVPEPGSVILLATVAGGIVLARRRKKLA
jgi:hypothetical protein